MNQALKNIALTLISLVFALVTLVIAEFLVRLTTDVGRLGTSANLFVNQAYDESIGNTPNAKSVAFGVEVFIDLQGFRISQSGTTPVQKDDDAIMMLGDYVE